MSGYRVENVVFKKGVGHFEHEFQGDGVIGVVHQRLMASEN